MTQSPILFSSPMIRALLEGRKTQTRRIVKRPTDNFHASYTHLRTDVIAGSLWWWDGEHERAGRSAPYPYAPGDLLWVRENWTFVNMSGEGERYDACIGYDADGPDLPNRPIIPITKEAYEALWDRKRDIWQNRRNPSIHMPRWASRITLEVTAVKVERLQDISEEDAKAEGAERPILPHWANLPYKSGFRGIWLDINGPASWDANPWVVAVSFIPHLRNIDQLIAARAA
jgi:hypothetical protein